MPSDVAAASTENRILLLPPTRRDAEAIEKILTGVNIGCFICATMADLCRETAKGAGAVLIAEEALTKDSEGFVSCVGKQPVWSDLSTIVLSRPGTEAPTLTGVLSKLGNVAVLERPVRITTLLSLVRSALRGRARQYEVRQRMNELAAASQAIYAGEERYRLLVENVVDYAIFLTDTEGRVTSWNAGAASILGYTENEVLGKSASLLLTREDGTAGSHDQQLQIALEQTRAFDSGWYVRKDGVKIFIESVTSVVRSESGKLIGFSNLMRDVTAGKVADGALRRSHDAFFNLVDRAPFGVYVIDSQFRVHSVNAGAQSVFTNVRPLVGRDFNEALRIIWPEPFASDALVRFRHTLETGESYIAPSLTETRQDVNLIQSYEWELHRIDLPDQQFGVVCYFYESTNLRRTEAALREAKRKSEAALLAGEVGTYYWNIVTGKLTGDVNFLSMFGVALDAEQSAPLEDFVDVIHPDDRASVMAQVQQTLATDAAYRAEYRILHPGGERWVAARGIVERNEKREPIGWAGVILDITGRKVVEEERQSLLESERAARMQAERAGQTKDEFLATLSHELRTPLNAILGWSQILAAGKQSEADLAEGLQTIERNARAQTQIIEDLLDMSRIISGKVRLDVQRISLAPVVQAAVETVRPAADAKDIRLQIVLDPLAGPVSGDPNRLQQVFWNLIANAVKFTPRGGRIQVVLERVNSHLEVGVVDTGEGIKPEFLPHVFDRFRQADASTMRHHGGLGLGLAIVKQLVELHGGTVRAKSPGSGQGSTFTVSLPLVIVHPEPEATSERRHPRAMPAPIAADGCDDIKGLKVLIVDDDADSRSLAKRLLEDCNAIVSVASSVATAIEILQKFQPEVLISDIGMPGEDGYSLIRRVRALNASNGGRVPAIALTAYARAEDRVNALRAGFQHHIVKPVEAAELIATVASLARQRSQE